jgi:hypothetical protein
MAVPVGALDLSLMQNAQDAVLSGFHFASLPQAQLP